MKNREFPVSSLDLCKYFDKVIIFIDFSSYYSELEENHICGNYVDFVDVNFHFHIII